MRLATLSANNLRHATSVPTSNGSRHEIHRNETQDQRQDRLKYIATAAYYKAEARGFMPGKELDDWLEAEAKFNAWAGH